LLSNDTARVSFIGQVACVLKLIEQRVDGIACCAGGQQFSGGGSSLPFRNRLDPTLIAADGRDPASTTPCATASIRVAHWRSCRDAGDAGRKRGVKADEDVVQAIFAFERSRREGHRSALRHAHRAVRRLKYSEFRHTPSLDITSRSPRERHLVSLCEGY